VEFCYDLRGAKHTVQLEPQPDGTYIAQIAGRVYRVQLQSAHAGRLDFTVDGRRYEAFTGRQQGSNLELNRRYVALTGSATSGEPRETRHYIFESVQCRPAGGAKTESEFTPVVTTSMRHDVEADRPHRRGAAIHRGSLEAHMPGQVVQLMVAEGDWVTTGQPLLVLEAMKMATRVVAPVNGRVSRLLVQEGDTVERGQHLVEVEPAAEPRP
jgi:biotin carboxyl carrier protein